MLQVFDWCVRNILIALHQILIMHCTILIPLLTAVRRHINLHTKPCITVNLVLFEINFLHKI